MPHILELCLFAACCFLALKMPVFVAVGLQIQPNRNLFHFFLWKKKRNPKKSHRRTRSAKNQRRSLKALKCRVIVRQPIAYQGTNAFLTFSPLIFFTPLGSVGVLCSQRFSFNVQTYTEKVNFHFLLLFLLIGYDII